MGITIINREYFVQEKSVVKKTTWQRRENVIHTDTAEEAYLAVKFAACHNEIEFINGVPHRIANGDDFARLQSGQCEIIPYKNKAWVALNYQERKELPQ